MWKVEEGDYRDDITCIVLKQPWLPPVLPGDPARDPAIEPSPQPSPAPQDPPREPIETADAE